MNQSDYINLASLIRGLCINATGKPWTVVPGPALRGSVPEEALWIDLGQAAGKENALDEQTLAEFLRERYSSWRTDQNPQWNSGDFDGTWKLPSCVAVTRGDAPGDLYWIDEDIDAARRRMNSGDTSPLQVNSKGTAKQPAGMDASARSGVVHRRIALVTGGAQGFGEEIVRGLAVSGALVFIADINLTGAEKLAGTINQEEGRTAAIPVQVNVSDEASVHTMFDTVEKTAGGLDLCISNAGVLRAGSVLDQDLKEFEFVTSINYTGFFIMSKFAGKLLRRQNRTAPDWKTDIIQINSKSGLEGSNKNGAYAGGKFGGIGLAASFALELIQYNIKVNAVCPGNFFDGPLWADPEKGLFAQYLKAGKVPGAKTVAEVKEFYEAKVPMKRGCTGPDVMRAIFYIVEQEYETGQAVPVTGGQVMLH